MTEHNWKPGDVGVTIPRYPNETQERFIVSGEPLRFNYADGVQLNFEPRDGGRPLVVIDPQDHKQVERLSDLLSLNWYGNAGFLAAALREFAAPPREVYRHFVTETGVDALVARCGKVWQHDENVTVVGDCPTCETYVREGWSA